MNIAFVTPIFLWLLPLMALPFINSLFERNNIPDSKQLAVDELSIWLNRVIKFSASSGLFLLVIGGAEPYLIEQHVTRTGNGAHIVFVLDRSASMNETFGGKTPDENEQSKGQAARRLLSQFVEQRPHDLFAVAGFSTQPFYVIPLTEHKSAVQAAINSLDTPGLAFTNVAKGLAMGLSYFESQPYTGSRVVVLVSDGAATLDHRAQRTLRDWFERHRVSLYWFFLRTENGLGIFSEPETARDDNPRVMPERYLHKFFQSLSVPYHPYEIDTAESLEAAIAELDQLESLPLIYQETLPRTDLSRWCYGIALVFVSFLLFVKLLERRT